MRFIKQDRPAQSLFGSVDPFGFLNFPCIPDVMRMQHLEQPYGLIRMGCLWEKAE